MDNNKPEKFPEFNERDTNYVYFRVKERDVFKVEAYEKFIKKHLKKRNRIPLRVFEKYLSFLTDNDEAKESFYEKQKRERVQRVIDYFKDDKPYYFKGTRKEESWFKGFGENKDEPVYFDIDYSFDAMIEEVSQHLVSHLTANPEYRTNKSVFLHSAFIYLKSYLDKNLDAKARKKYIDSRIQTIAGYMAYVFGHDIAYTAPVIKKKQVFNAVKYHFNKAKKPRKKS